MIRKIHLDFHTHPDTTEIGLDFSPETFARTLADAHVNYLATPGKCHFGNLYHRSRIGRTHQHLFDPDLFPATVSACGRHGIKVQAYWTLGLDAYAAQQHPEWRQRHADGSYATWGHYLHMCFASPYIDEVVIPEIRECVERCPGLAGVWFDICLYVDGAFYSESFTALATDRLAVDDREHRWQLARELIRERCCQIDAAIKEVLPDAENYFNSLVVPGEAHNLPLQPWQEVENPLLFHGPEKMTAHVRWLRAHDAPTIGLVSRFQGPWSDPGTLRTEDQMRFDVARTVALGCHVSMGDHRYPDGHLEPEVYRQLAPIYGEVEALEPLLTDTHSQREAVLLGTVRKAEPGQILPEFTEATVHAARLLEELGLQFDIVAVDEEIPDLDLVIWPGEEAGSQDLLERLGRHVNRGGALLAMAHAIAKAEDFFGVHLCHWHPSSTTPDADMSGIGHVSGPATATNPCGPANDFFRLRPELGGPDFPQIMSFPTRRLASASGTEILADRLHPTSASPAFAAPQAMGPAMAQKGRVIYSAVDLFGEDRERGAPIPRQVIGKLCDRLLARRLVEHNGGTSVAAHLHRTPSAYVLHLVHWALDRWGKKVNSAATFPRLGAIDVRLSIKERVEVVTMEPQHTEIPFSWEDGALLFTVPEMHIWQVLAIALE